MQRVRVLSIDHGQWVGRFRHVGDGSARERTHPGIPLVVAAFVILSSVVAQAVPNMNLAVIAGDELGSSNVTLGPGCTVPYSVSGELSDSSSRGLAGFGFDLVFDGGALEAGRVPTEASYPGVIPLRVAPGGSAVIVAADH